MDAWRKFLAKHPVKAYAKGQMIVCQNTAPRRCFVVRRGFVKAYFITADGVEKPINFEGINDMFPFDLVFGHTKSASYFYEAYTRCEIYSIPRKELAAFVYAQPLLLGRFFHYLINRTRDSHEHIASLEQAKAIDKLICALNLFVRRFSKPLTNHKARLLLPLTQQELAGFLGLTRETTGAQLKTLEQDGVLEYHRQKYTINTKRLNLLVQQRL